MDRTSVCAHAAVIATVLTAGIAAGGDWTNLGGNHQRNGLTAELGPQAADLLWTNNDDYSIIAWHPFIYGRRVFTVREWDFPQNGGQANDAVVAYDLDSGTELWRHELSFGGDTNVEWIAWIAGVRDGRVYASRASNGKPQPIKALDMLDGHLLWTSQWNTEAFAYDGVVFAPDGDLIVGDFYHVARINAEDGATVWVASRSCPVSGNCGGAAAVTRSAVYIDEAAPGGNIITKLDLETGAELYSSPVMPGFTDQNSPFVSPDETTVYFSRTQNNPAVDYLYAFLDDGTQFVELWRRPVRWTTSHEHGLASDGSIFTFLPDDQFVRLDPFTGDVLYSAGVLSPLGSPNLSAKTAVDAAGNVYVSNGWASSPATNGRLWAFTPDLSQMLFVLTLDRQNQGGPAVGAAGTLVVTDRRAVYAYRSNQCPTDLDGDWDTDLADLAQLLSAYGTVMGDAGHLPAADFDKDGDVDLADLAVLLAAYGCDS